MPSYFIRVEMLSADSKQYEQLHDAMARYNFFPTIRGDSGQLQQLPTGCYQGVSRLPVHDVREQVRAITDHIGVTSYIFVCDFENWSSYLVSAN